MHWIPVIQYLNGVQWGRGHLDGGGLGRRQDLILLGSLLLQELVERPGRSPGGHEAGPGEQEQTDLEREKENILEKKKSRSIFVISYRRLLNLHCVNGKWAGKAHL